MKIAVCMSGQLRLGNLAFPNIRRFFGELFSSVDFFIHTWDTNLYRNVMAFHNITVRPPIRVYKRDLKTYKSLYQPKKFLVGNQKDFIRPLKEKYNIVGDLAYSYYSFYKAMELKNQYQKENNIEYDVVVKLRPDLLFPSDRTFQKDLTQFINNKDNIYSCRSDDFYQLGNDKNMRINANFFEYYQSDYTQWPMNGYLKYLDLKNIKFFPLKDGRFTVLRPESSYMNVLTEYDHITILNAHLYDNVFYSTHNITSFYVNHNSNDWIEDMYNVFDRVLGKSVTEKMEKTLNVPRKKQK
jgi:hypothetical protein